MRPRHSIYFVADDVESLYETSSVKLFVLFFSYYTPKDSEEWKHDVKALRSVRQGDIDVQKDERAVCKTRLSDTFRCTFIIDRDTRWRFFCSDKEKQTSCAHDPSKQCAWAPCLQKGSRNYENKVSGWGSIIYAHVDGHDSCSFPCFPVLIANRTTRFTANKSEVMFIFQEALTLVPKTKTIGRRKNGVM